MTWTLRAAALPEAEDANAPARATSEAGAINSEALDAGKDVVTTVVAVAGVVVAGAVVAKVVTAAVVVGGIVGVTYLVTRNRKGKRK